MGCSCGKSAPSGGYNVVKKVCPEKEDELIALNKKVIEAFKKKQKEIRDFKGTDKTDLMLEANKLLTTNRTIQNWIHELEVRCPYQTDLDRIIDFVNKL